MNIKAISVVAALACGVSLPVGATAAGLGDWAGGYIGGHLGYGMDNGVNLDYGGGSVSSSFDMTGYMIGLQGGYNWAVGPVVLGVEGDASYADIKGDAACPNPTWTCAAKMDQLITVRARVGAPVGKFLLFGTLGVASGQVEAKTTSPLGVEYPGSDRQTGWIAGIGGQLAFSKNLLGRAELTYTDLGSNDYIVDFGSIVSVETKVIGLRVGADWKF